MLIEDVDGAGVDVVVDGLSKKKWDPCGLWFFRGDELSERTLPAPPFS